MTRILSVYIYIYDQKKDKKNKGIKLNILRWCIAKNNDEKVTA